MIKTFKLHLTTLFCCTVKLFFLSSVKVSIEELSEKIEEFEDFVQSVDVAAFNKI